MLARIFLIACFALWIGFSGGIVRAEIDFNRDVRPILSDRCFKCHGPDTSNQESDFRLDSFENATMDLGGYAGIVPGDLEASVLHGRIHDADDPMPPADDLKQLSEADKAILDEWIAGGAKFESHWSFQPLPKSIDVPNAGDGWAHGPIDRFVAKGLQEAGLSPTKPTSREKWLRRVTFDLTGLPPTTQEILEFLSDNSPLAEQTVVERLLGSVACAERLTSEWLDVARYADTYGYQRDDSRFVWPYRDWVIDAFQDRMPYDQFILWQLAGDLLPNATREQRLATTFNRLHSHKKEGGVAVEEFRVENVADRTHTVGAAFLGLTMECCRCHDHKYDPLSQANYYSLGAFFDNIDENGLISFFTSAVPTPAMPLPNPEQEKKWEQARKKLTEVEQASEQDRSKPLVDRFEAWLPDRDSLKPISGLVAHLPIDEFDAIAEEDAKSETGGKQPIAEMHSLANMAGNDAVTTQANTLIEGRFGKAIQLTGDDSVVLPGVGHFERHDPFSISLWVWSPSTKERSVIVRRSRGWGDAGSVGYELTQDEGVLMARMCHFWPGDAIAIQTDRPIPAKTWTHVTMTYDGSSRAAGLKLFIDGKLANTEIVKNNLTRSVSKWNGGYRDLAIGSRYRDRGFKDGRVDEFRVYDRQLSLAEVSHLHDGHSLVELLSIETNAIEEEQRHHLLEYYRLAVDGPSADARKNLRSARQQLNQVLDNMPSIMVMRETPKPRQSYILDRGVYNQRGEPVEPETPGFLPPMDEDLPRNRLGLAKWITDPDHPLTARVTVNRYWQLMFGNGLVRTPEDFGNQGEMPTHPELLDWLSRDFVEHGWNVHRLLSQMALSATYRQSIAASASSRAQDPENRLFSRGTDHRLSAEMIRDNILATSGLLVDRVGGPPVKPYDVALAYNPLPVDKGDRLYRRSLYTFWKRTSPAPMMTTLNAPTRQVCRVKREITNTPLQALVLLNSPQFVEASRVMATNLIKQHGENREAMITQAFVQLTSRTPSEAELEILVQLFQEQLAEFESSASQTTEFLSVGQTKPNTDLEPAVLAATTVFIQSVMNLDECVRHQ